MKIIPLKDGDIVPFVAIDLTPGGNNLGRAEFQFCPVWRTVKRDRRLTDVFIYPRQQHNMPHGWHVTGFRSTDFQIDSYTHKGIDLCNPWLYGWCKEHRCMTVRVYVPANANCFSVQVLTTLGVYFDAK